MRLYFKDSWQDRLPAFFFQNRSSLQLLGLYLGFLVAPVILIGLIYLLFSDLAIVLALSALVVAFFSLLFCVWLLAWILKHDCGSQAMQDVSEPIKEGSEGFFRTQYGTIFRLAIIFATLLFLLYFFKGSNKNPIFGATSTAIITALSFMFGAVCSALSGYAGMWVSVRANIRVTSAARRCYNEALQLCFRGGAFGAIINVALAIFGISFQYLLLRMFISIQSASLTTSQISEEQKAIGEIPLKLVGFGFGASFVAMFAQLGGGIYTKAADVGADLVGKVQQGIPEDDARNPAVIADLVGDNVGDCAGQAADLFESISAEIISVMILGGEICKALSLDKSLQAGFVLFPLGVHCLDLIASSFGVFFVRTKRGIAAAFSSIDFDEEDDEIVSIGEEEDDLESSTSTNIASPKKMSKPKEHKHKSGNSYHDAPVSGLEEPLDVMKRGYYVAIVVGLIGFYVLSSQLLSFTTKPEDTSSLYFFGCGVVGMVVSYLFVIITQYYTDYNHTPVRNIAKSSVTGHATNIIAGLSVGLESTALPILVIAVSILLTFNLGSMALEDYKLLGDPILHGNSALSVGLFATAVATMGMFSTGVFVLSMSGFGPIADNAGGIAEMSHQEGHIRVITDKLDAVGNVTKANTKGYSVGSASLACFLMFSAYLDEVSNSNAAFERVIDIAQPPVFIGGLLGSMVVFLFSSWAILAVGNAAQDVINEVVRQFKEYPEIMEYKHKPNYGGCVSIVAKAGLREMIKPGLLSVVSPILVGMIFTFIGSFTNQPFLGAKVTAGFLMFATATGILMALFFNNGGGAWDNAKKYIETGQFGGKGSAAHKAAVTGDTVGDPCKDTAGPSIHILIKLLSTITLVMAPLLV